jgi:serine/threonine protein kinase/Tfp pilus assembly protein PilF
MNHPLLRRLRSGKPVAGEHLGGYELLEVVARGGQGFVIEARHTGLDMRVALKILDPQGGAASPERFRQEGQVLARLRHPSLPRVTDLGEIEGLLFLALDLIDGPTLEEVVDEALPLPTWSARITADVAEALAHCHRHGIVHRDVKPPNVVLNQDLDRAILVDFGLLKRDSKASGFGSLEELSLSRSNEVKGSPEFMAPEQADPEGERGPVGPAADLHGLGATLYFLLTGQPPYAGDTTAMTLVEVLRHTPPRPQKINPGVPRWLDALCMQALAKDPSHRPESCAAFAAALRAGDTPSNAGERESDSSREVVVDLSAVSDEARPDSAPRHTGRSSRRAKAVSGRRKRAEIQSSRLANALGLESAEELPAYRPPAARGRPRIEGQSTGPAWAIGAGIVLVFVAAGLVTGQSGPGAGAAVFLAGVIPLVASFVAWRGSQAREAKPGGKVRTRSASLRELDAILERARQALGERDASRAAAAADEVLDLRPDHALALALRGAARVLRREVAAGVIDLDAALDLEPDLAFAYSERGGVRYRLGDLLGALADFDALAELTPEDPEVFANRGACHYKAKDYQQALADFDRCLELAPEEVETYRRRGRVRFKARDFSGAIADWTEVLELTGGDDMDALRKRSIAYQRLGWTEEAKRDEELLEELNASGSE